MYRGRYILGDHVPLLLWCRDGAGTPGEPDATPLVRVYSATALVLARKMPVLDRYVLDGVFQDRLQLSALFTTGPHRAVYHYTLGGTQYGDEDVFEVVAGGDGDGSGISMYFFRAPRNDSVLLQCDGGRLLRKRNPRVP